MRILDFKKQSIGCVNEFAYKLFDFILTFKNNIL